MTRRKPLAALLAAVCAFVSVQAGGLGSRAWAETAAARADSDTARARTLFQEGLRLSDQRRWQDAVERFQEALELKDAPAIRYNLAVSLARLERFVLAAEQLDAVLAHEETTRPLRQNAETLLTQVQEHSGHIRNHVAEYSHPVSVQLDGRPLAPERLDTVMRLAVGNHLLTAVSQETVVARLPITVRAGQTEVVTLYPVPPAEVPAPTAATLEQLPPPVAPASPTAEEPAGRSDGRRRSLARDWRLWLGVGSGLAVTAVVLGLVFGIEKEPEDPISGNMEPGVLVWR